MSKDLIDRVREKIYYLFHNNADCYSQTTDSDRHHPAMSEEKFMEIVYGIIKEREADGLIASEEYLNEEG